MEQRNARQTSVAVTRAAPPRFLTPRDLAVVLDAPLDLIESWLRTAQLPAARLGDRYFVERDALIEFVRGRIGGGS